MILNQIIQMNLKQTKKSDKRILNTKIGVLKLNPENPNIRTPKLHRSIVARMRKFHAAGFENLIRSTAVANGFACIRIPNGAETKITAMGKRLVRVRTPFDFVISKTTTDHVLMMKDGGLWSKVKHERSIFFDAKTSKEKVFAPSLIKTHQIYWLMDLEKKGLTAGYVVRFEALNETYFFKASYLEECARLRESAKPSCGLMIGTGTVFNFNIIIED